MVSYWCCFNIYFSGKNPDFIPKYKINNLTSFRQEVIAIMSTISYGSTITYNDISKIIAQKRGIKRMSSQAVGGANAGVIYNFLSKTIDIIINLYNHFIIFFDNCVKISKKIGIILLKISKKIGIILLRWKNENPFINY